MPETVSDRSLVARIAAHTSWANTPDRTARTAPARAAQDRRWEDQVDPNRVLPEAERARRVESARRAHFLALARKSALARAARRTAPKPNPADVSAARAEELRIQRADSDLGGDAA